MKTITSKRLDHDEMAHLLDMLNITRRILQEADEQGESTISVFTLRKTRLEEQGESTISVFTLRKTRLEGLYILTITFNFQD